MSFLNWIATIRSILEEKSKEPTELTLREIILSRGLTFPETYLPALWVDILKTPFSFMQQSKLLVKEEQNSSSAQSLVLANTPIEQLKTMPQSEWLFGVWELLVDCYPWEGSHHEKPSLLLDAEARTEFIQIELSQGVILNQPKLWNEARLIKEEKVISEWVEDKLERIQKALELTPASPELTLRSICNRTIMNQDRELPLDAWCRIAGIVEWMLYAALFKRLISESPTWFKHLFEISKKKPEANAEVIPIIVTAPPVESKNSLLETIRLQSKDRDLVAIFLKILPHLILKKVR